MQIHCYDFTVKLVDDKRKFGKIWQVLDPICHVILKLVMVLGPGKCQRVLKKKIDSFIPYLTNHLSLFFLSSYLLAAQR
jgi:hypothetical protein